MKKVIVTLRSPTAATVDVPEHFPRRRGERKERPRAIERSVFGTLKIFPGVPKTVSEDELEFLRFARPELALEVAKYVESRRVDYRGAGESEIEDLAEREGIGHLDFGRKVARLVERGRVKVPEKSTETLIVPKKKQAEVGGARKK